MSLRLLLLWICGILYLFWLVPEENSSVHTAKEPSRALQCCMERLHEAQLDSTTEQLAIGLLFGQKASLSKEIKEEVRAAGMSHMLAVSGLHIGLIWGLLWLFLRPLSLLSTIFNWNEINLLFLLRFLVLCALWGYIWLVGAPSSALRAGLMITLTQLSIVFHKDAWGWHNLWLAALIILIIEPSQLFEVGFQLSVAATAGILSFQPLIRQSSKLLSIFWLSISAQFFTFPLCAYYFGQVPLLGWVQGFLVVPLLPFLMYGLVALICFPMVWNGLVELISTWLLNVAHGVTMAEQYLVGGEVIWHPSLLELFLMEVFMYCLFESFKRFFSKQWATEPIASEG